MEKNCCVVKKEENGFLLSPCELVNQTSPTGIIISPLLLSHSGCTLLWFINFLNGAENTPDKYPIDGITYRAFRDSGNVYLEETRDGGIISVVGFSLKEIPEVLEALKIKIT